MVDERHQRLAAAARAAVDRLFSRAKLRLGLLRDSGRDKRIVATLDPDLSLPGLYEASARGHGLPPRPGATQEVRRSASGFLEAQAEAAKAAVGRIVHHLTAGDKVISANDRKELEEALGTVLDRTGDAVERIVDSEATAARNLAGIDAIGALNAASGVDDPVVFFVIVRDGKACDECVDLHLLDDGVTPKLWYLSECEKSYHKRGSGRPSTMGEHPRCRCSMTTMMPGYGFSESGLVRFVAPGHREIEKQRAGA